MTHTHPAQGDDQHLFNLIGSVLAQYDLPGSFRDCEQLVNGHINDTYLVRLQNGDIQTPYILQRINEYVFKEPVKLMDNIRAIASHLAGRQSDSDCRIITFLDNRAGQNYTRQAGTWRLCPYIADSIAYEQADDVAILNSAGYAFGRFQALLADMPLDALAETIPDFHNTPQRLAQFFAAAKRDTCGRAAAVQREIAFFEQVSDLACSLVHLEQTGVIPLRVTHNDTKYNNILMDRNTGRPLCVIDLDTVMPGLSPYDFGDAIRFAANDAAEDEPDLDKVSLNMSRYQAFAEGFVTAAAPCLTQSELDNMALGAIVITIELASRFLLDHLEGDRYFRIHRPGHNLDRARSQIRLAQDMISKRARMEAAIRSTIKAMQNKGDRS
jgi:Ser/Thr protein kinase RdoA (MazF antagonist)